MAGSERIDPADEPVRPPRRVPPLDMSKDPDRYDPTRDPSAEALRPPGPLDRALDPDRYLPGSGDTLPELLGPGAQEEERDNATWALGLVAVIGFLLLITFLFGFLHR